MEIAVAVFVVVWIGLYFVVASASKRVRVSRYAWAARAARQVAFFCGLGAFLAVVGSDWRSPFWERAIGCVLIAAGIGLASRTVLRRKRVQSELESGEKEPISGG